MMMVGDEVEFSLKKMSWLFQFTTAALEGDNEGKHQTVRKTLFQERFVFCIPRVYHTALLRFTTNLTHLPFHIIAIRIFCSY
jgi:hypothetical protein